MNGKLTMVLALGLSMAFSQGCSLQDLTSGLQAQAAGLGQIAAAPGTTSSPLTSSLTSALPAGVTSLTNPSATAGLAGISPTFTPAAPTTTTGAVDPSTGLPLSPNATTPAVAAAGTTPQAVAVGTGAIDPSTLPTIPAAGTTTALQ